MTYFNKFPCVEVASYSETFQGWEKIITHILSRTGTFKTKKPRIAVEYYQGVLAEEVTRSLVSGISPGLFINTTDLMWGEEEIRKMVYPDVTDDRIFGYLTRLNLDEYFNPEKVEQAKERIRDARDGTVLVVGPGAYFICDSADLLIYADMARWEIQLRMRTHEVDNLGLTNRNTEDWMLLYKQGFFVDWRVLDRWKKKLLHKWDYLLDTNDRYNPKMVSGNDLRAGLETCLTRPFSLVPFFDPGLWGGQWMKEKFNLDPAQQNYAWCFNCVPEENSLLLKFGDTLVEIPAINLVFYSPAKLLGESVHARFGDEFPIRFDYLDTMGGGNLSLQVHPLTEYIQEKFGMHYTQDESYYIMDASEGAQVYLGLKENIDRGAMIAGLESAQQGEKFFEAEKFVQTWPAKKHDHFLIPAGTVHCSGVNSMVLEISATPYIFTFKVWDWGRLGLDGKPRPINIDHAKNVIQWQRKTSWVKENLVNKIEKIAEGSDWIEEKTGLHEREFIETRRHWFTGKVEHAAGSGVNVLNLIEGDEILVESPSGLFEPFTVNYAETFIIPASAGNYSIRPHGVSEGKKCATIKAYVR
jgi:mannose-6-phosphate isomerase class I